MEHFFDQARAGFTGKESDRRITAKAILRLSQPAVRLGRITEDALRQRGDPFESQRLVRLLDRQQVVCGTPARERPPRDDELEYLLFRIAAVGEPGERFG